jgi:hypothetical protein
VSILPLRGKRSARARTKGSSRYGDTKSGVRCTRQERISQKEHATNLAECQPPRFSPPCIRVGRTGRQTGPLRPQKGPRRLRYPPVVRYRVTLLLALDTASNVGRLTFHRGVCFSATRTAKISPCQRRARLRPWVARWGRWSLGFRGRRVKGCFSFGEGGAIGSPRGLLLIDSLKRR